MRVIGLLALCVLSLMILNQSCNSGCGVDDYDDIATGCFEIEFPNGVSFPNLYYPQINRNVNNFGIGRSAACLTSRDDFNHTVYGVMLSDQTKTTIVIDYQDSLANDTLVVSYKVTPYYENGECRKAFGLTFSQFNVESFTVRKYTVGNYGLLKIKVDSL